MNSDCKLLVLEGAHAGAEIALADGIYLIGSDLGCDLVLLDPGVAGKHLRLRVENGRVGAERIGEAIVMLHGVPMQEASFSPLDKDEVGLGSAVFRLVGVAAPAVTAAEDADEPPALEIFDDTPAPSSDAAQAGLAAAAHAAAPRAGRRHHPVVWGLPLSVIVVGLTAFFGSRALQASAPLRLPDAQLAVPAAEMRDELVARVREFLSDDGLNVQRDLQGRIVVSGKTRALVVRQQLADLKNEFKEAVEIVDRVSYVSDNDPHTTVRLPQRITDIHVGGVRWFQTADGMRNFEGTVLADGAEVVRIGIDGIVFRKGGKLAIFRLNEEERTK